MRVESIYAGGRLGQFPDQKPRSGNGDGFLGWLGTDLRQTITGRLSMTVRDALRISIDTGSYIGLGYIEDLTESEMLHRPAPKSNHIKWQLGHLIFSENWHIDLIAPNSMPPLPEGFKERYDRDKAAIDDATAFDSRDFLLGVFAEQRERTITLLEEFPEEQFEKETGIEYAPTAAAMFSLQGSHWLMHAGQWAVIRRQLGKDPLY